MIRFHDEWEAPLCSIDPVTLGTLAIGALAGSGAAAASGAFSGDTSTTIETPAASTPAQNPIGSKPAKKSAQPSFLAGASMLPQAGGSPATAGTGGGGKTLLGQ